MSRPPKQTRTSPWTQGARLVGVTMGAIMTRLARSFARLSSSAHDP